MEGGGEALSLCALLVKSMWIVNLLNVCMIHVGVSIEHRKKWIGAESKTRRTTVVIRTPELVFILVINRSQLAKVDLVSIV